MPKEDVKVGFHPNKSHVSADALATFIRGEITGNLLEIPGIGVASEAAFRKEGISSTHQVLGKFLSLKEEGVESVDVADRFYYWLDHVGIKSTRAGVVLSIAEKLSMTFQGLYDPSAYTAEEENTEDPEIMPEK